MWTTIRKFSAERSDPTRSNATSGFSGGGWFLKTYPQHGWSPPDRERHGALRLSSSSQVFSAERFPTAGAVRSEPSLLTGSLSATFKRLCGFVDGCRGQTQPFWWVAGSAVLTLNWPAFAFRCERSRSAKPFAPDTELIIYGRNRFTVAKWSG